jgi:hypothetical protein
MDKIQFLRVALLIDFLSTAKPQFQFHAASKGQRCNGAFVSWQIDSFGSLPVGSILYKRNILLFFGGSPNVSRLILPVDTKSTKLGFYINGSSMGHAHAMLLEVIPSSLRSQFSYARQTSDTIYVEKY